MTFSVIVTLFFRLVNFAILIAAFVYIYKKYIRDLLVQGVRQEYEALKNLERCEKDALSQRIVLEQQLYDDQELIIELKKKITLWAHAQRVCAQDRAVYKENFIKKLKEQSDFKQLRIAEYILEKESMPLIISQARDRLSKQFNDERSGHYIQSAVDSLSKKSVMS